jgi:hypothetical protein
VRTTTDKTGTDKTGTDKTGTDKTGGERSLLKRLGWFALLYVASFTTVAAVAYGLKAVIPH